MTEIDPTPLPIPTTDVPAPRTDPEDEPDEAADLAEDDAFDEGQDRLWLRTITGMLQGKISQDPSDRVQKSIERMLMAAADRASRILRNDITDH